MTIVLLKYIHNFVVENPKFIVDSMLGKIAKKLRIFGFSTDYYKDIDDNFLIKKSICENKILITKDKQLYNRAIKFNANTVLLYKENELENLILVFRKCNIRSIGPIPNMNTRCTLCNGILISMDKSLVVNDVPYNVYINSTKFYRCSICSKIYWDGTHIQDIRMLINRINNELDLIA